MGIDGLSGKAARFWAQAKSALAGNLNEPPASPPAPMARGDSAQLSGADRVFAGYAMPVPSHPDPADSANPGPGGLHLGEPDAGGSDVGEPGSGATRETKLWAPLVITPPDSPL